MKINLLNQNIYNYKNTQRQSQVSFEGITNNKLYNAIVDKTAESCAKLVSTKPVEKIFKETKSDKLFAHLIVAGSTLLSGFYIAKTLTNKEMDEKRRKTLAINQGLVYTVSTIMAYTFDGWIKQKEKASFKKFKALHSSQDSKLLHGLQKLYPQQLKTLDEKSVTKFFDEMMPKWEKGFGIARTTMVLGTVYRFIAPVIVTPIANAISNKLHNKKQA